MARHHCTSCSKPLLQKNGSGLCRPCWRVMKAKARQTACRSCSAPIARTRQTGLCRACVNKDPALLARRGKTISEVRRRKFAEDPAWAAARREHGSWLYHNHAVNVTISEEARVRAGRGVSATRLAWCPPEYRAQYRKMVSNMHFSAAEAKAMILEQVEADRRREEASATPFDKMLQRVRGGASISVKQVLPSKSYDFTLGGVTGAML